mmetsp:Transcript_13947/g.17555  ORF Transcript_13947/g.17555 Transcript_13947/m.17555 type:complete len:453 (-) Transcript_13947:202-1560(-)
MVFDFFKKRAEEGLDQLSNIASSAKTGNITGAFRDAAQYTADTNAAFALGLAKSRNRLLYELDDLMNNDGVDFMESLEDVLLQADIGLQTAEDVMNEVRSLKDDSTTFFSRDDLRSVLRGKLIENLEYAGDRRLNFSPTNSSLPTVYFVMGANGMGKTTTIGKLAHRLRTEGDQKVMLAACDTFRAAAVQQLEMWAERAGNVTCFSPAVEGDSSGASASPAAILYGALDVAVKEGYDTVIVDTSGRLSNNDALTQELKKMKGVIQKRLSVEVDGETGKPVPNLDVPHETLIVIDAAQGRMALDSARQWDKDVGLTGLVLTKLDGSAKGGSVVAVSRELGLPVKLIGVGEGLLDLRDFEPEAFVDGLLGIGTEKGKGNEAKLLSDRLTKMRKARDERAKVMKTSTSTVDSNAGEKGRVMSEATAVPATAGGGNAGGPSRKPNRKKKSKKKGRR